jgi:hypothetical protein
MNTKKIIATFVHISKFFVIFGISFLLLGEIYFRSPLSEKLLCFEYDPVLANHLKPNQIGVTYIGQCIFTPPITINQLGYRGSDIDPGKKKILCLGSSEVLGTGVKDNECWPSNLNNYINTKFKRYQVVNAGQMGYGPYHNKIMLFRFIERFQRPDLVILRLATGDKDFLPPSAQRLANEERKIARNVRIKKVSLFLPYLMNKISLQEKSIKRTLEKVWSFNKKENNPSLNAYEVESVADTFMLRFKSDINEMLSVCNTNNIPVVLCVIDPISTPASAQLVENVDNFLHTNAYTNIKLLYVNSADFGLDKYILSERKKISALKYQVEGDPHSNASQHKIVASKLYNYLLNNKLLLEN